jgi:hypothetical protein
MDRARQPVMTAIDENKRDARNGELVRALFVNKQLYTLGKDITEQGKRFANVMVGTIRNRTRDYAEFLSPLSVSRIALASSAMLMLTSFAPLPCPSRRLWKSPLLTILRM